MATNQGFKSFVPIPDRMHAPYLYWWLRANRAYLQELGNGATFKEVSKTVVSRIEIPLPPISEQRRIATILARVDSLKIKRRITLGQLDELARATFFQLFGDPVTNSKGWPEDRVLDDVADISSGITKGRKLNGASTREVPYLAVVNVQDRRLDLTTVKTIEATEAEIGRYHLEGDDLLLTEGGDPDKLGRGSLWKEEVPECIHQNHIFRVRLTTDHVTPLFLNWLIGSARGKKYFLKSAKQTTGIASINLRQLRAFPMLTPPPALQERFALAIDGLSSLTAGMQQSLTSLDALFTSLQHRAFRGEL
jgi:type I restriction enzyme S subunit